MKLLGLWLLGVPTIFIIILALIFGIR